MSKAYEEQVGGARLYSPILKYHWQSLHQSHYDGREEGGYYTVTKTQYLWLGPYIEDVCNMIVQIFSFHNIILQPVVTLLINILDKKWIEGIDVSH